MTALVLAFWLSTQLAVPERLQLTIAGQPVEVTADHIILDPARGRAELLGQAVVQLAETRLSAAQIALEYRDPEHATATASGQVVLQDPQRGRLTAARLRLDLASRNGELIDTQVTLPLEWQPSFRDLVRPEEVPREVRVTAAAASKVGDRLDLRQASISIGDIQPPQFELAVGSAQLQLGPQNTIGGLTRLRTGGAKVRLYGRTVFNLPAIDLQASQLFIPHVGVNRSDGFFVEHSFAVGHLLPFRLSFTPRLGTDSNLTGRGRLALGTNFGSFDLIGSQKERYLLLTQAQAVQVSRVPEFGYTLPKNLKLWGGQLKGRASYGLYDEEAGLTTWRSSFDLGYERPLHRGRTSAITANVGGHLSTYATGGNYRWLRGGLQVEKQFGALWYLGGTINSHLLSGGTPFRFDQVEVATALTIENRLRLSRHWLVGNDLLLDLNEGVLRSEQYSIWYRDRLLEYGVSCSTRPGFELNLDFHVLGF
ncbi:MAG: hypothetical protein IT204_07175 [Fimbriimonadaceae bacterium]|nr:hypothetical protein [Fimbriimonadaceae bacterium]